MIESIDIKKLLDEEFPLPCPHCGGSGKCPNIEKDALTVDMLTCDQCGAERRNGGIDPCLRCNGEGRVVMTLRNWVGEWFPQAIKAKFFQ